MTDRERKAADELSFICLADIGPLLSMLCDATDSDKLRRIASKLTGARMDYEHERRRATEAAEALGCDFDCERHGGPHACMCPPEQPPRPESQTGSQTGRFKCGA